MKYTKVMIVTLFCIGFVLGSVSLTFGQGGAPPFAGLNYEKIALLKWYGANQSGASFAVSSPNAMAFDGANMWVTGSNGVTKLRAADGANLGTFPVGDFSAAFSVAFDGANIWVTDGIFALHKLRAADGVELCDVSVSSPLAVAFDGTYIYVGSSDALAVVKVRVSDCLFVNPIHGFSYPNGMAFDGTNMWVTDQGRNTVRKGLVGQTFNVGHGPVGVAFDGTNIWVANSSDGTVTKLRASDGLTLGTFNVGGSPSGVVFDGANIWVTNNGFLTELRASDGAKLGTFNTSYPAYGVAFDGANIWAGCGAGVCKF
jgi:hypothetical protein